MRKFGVVVSLSMVVLLVLVGCSAHTKAPVQPEEPTIEKMASAIFDWIWSQKDHMQWFSLPGYGEVVVRASFVEGWSLCKQPTTNGKSLFLSVKGGRFEDVRADGFRMLDEAFSNECVDYWESSYGYSPCFREGRDCELRFQKAWVDENGAGKLAAEKTYEGNKILEGLFSQISKR